MANYTIYYADLLKTPLTITELTTRGPTHSSSSTPDPLNSGTVVAPILFYGDGVVDYGARLQQNILNILENFSSGTAPAVPVTGQLWHDATNGAVKFWSGSAWVGLISSVDLSTYLQKSGGTMTGLLTLSGAPTSNLHAATKLYVDTAVTGAGTNILPLNNTFSGKNWFQGIGADPLTTGHAYTFAGGTVTGAGDPTRNAAAVGSIIFNGPATTTAMGVWGRALLQSGSNNTLYGGAFEAWTYPAQMGTLHGVMSSVVSQYSDNTAQLSGLSLKFMTRADGVASTTMLLGNNRYNHLSRAINITAQSPSTAGEYSGWATGVYFSGMSRTSLQSRAHLIDFYDSITDQAGVNPLILTWKDRTTTARHGMFYNTTNGFLEFWRDVYGTSQRIGYIDFNSTSRDFDILNAAVTKLGGDNIDTDLSFSPSGPSIYRPGMVWNSNTTNNLSMFNGTIATIDSTISTQTNTITLTGTAVETPIVGTGWGGTTFPANYFTIGKTVHIRVMGRVTTTGDNLRIRVKLGPAVTPPVLNDAAYVAVPSMTNQIFTLDFIFTCRVPGATGLFRGQGYLMCGDTMIPLTSGTNTTIDSTVVSYISITAEWQGAAGTIETTNHVVQVHA